MAEKTITSIRIAGRRGVSRLSLIKGLEKQCFTTTKGGAEVDKLIRIKELAKILDVSEDFCYTAAREGVIPVVKVGRSLRFSSKAIEAFIESGGKSLDRRSRLKAG